MVDASGHFFGFLLRTDFGDLEAGGWRVTTGVRAAVSEASGRERP